MENISLDENLKKSLDLCDKLENQARTMAALDRKYLALAEQQKLVRRNFVKTQKKFSEVCIDLHSAIQEEGGVTEDQLAGLDQVLDRLAKSQKTIESLVLISRKGN